MLFNTGYTLHKSVFFKNIKYILLFGVVGTFLSFLVSWGLIYEANNLGSYPLM
jgi:NhaP-type Na+/H+ or K+/H+ antiporter